MNQRLITLSVVLLVLSASSLTAEDRTIDGTLNHLTNTTQGAANQPMIRFGYKPEFADLNGAIITEPVRANPRDISNALFAQTTSRKSARGLSDLAWAFGQFLAHDMDLVTSSNGAAVNGTAPIAIHGQNDPLGPNPIPFTRSNYVMVVDPRAGSGRTPVNEVTSYIDASNVYGSDPVRAAALRTNAGIGAKLLTGAGNLLPFNTAGLPNENNGPVPASQLFLAGDIRANENSLLTSLHTVFAREHNRLVDRIAAEQPALNEEQQYQLARKIVGAEMQAITYKEFLPALLGSGATVPKVEQYQYTSNIPATITNAFAHATYRFGHSMVSPELKRVDGDGAPQPALSLRNAFFNPNLLTNNPALVDQLLAGAATQRSEEVDALVIDDLRNFLFGPPGAGGLDLAALNIQRGRDVGLPDYRELRSAHQVPFLQSFGQITSDAALAGALSSIYGGNLNNIDAWVGALAESHVAGTSVGPLIKAMLESQFRRLRDGDRLFYRGTAAGLYAQGGILNPEIAAIIDLDNFTLADVILANTSIEHLQENLFFVPTAGDFNGDGAVDAADYVVWRKYSGQNNVWADGDGNGTVGPEDLALWRANYHTATLPGPIDPSPAGVPEPSAIVLLVAAFLTPALSFYGRRAPARRPQFSSVARGT
jgi:Animal haem peroxidase